jgi:hypothetical protein
MVAIYYLKKYYTQKQSETNKHKPFNTLSLGFSISLFTVLFQKHFT